jgi:geranylgeranyl diphosphate synthase, type I
MLTNPSRTTACPLVESVGALLRGVEDQLCAVLEQERGVWRADDPPAAPVLDALARFVGDGGKRIRPRFCIWAYLAGDSAADHGRVVSLGAAIELLHAFALIHDDVMDESEQRRGRPSVHAAFAHAHRQARGAGNPARFGESMAILAGDLAHVLAERLMLDQPLAVRREWHAMQIELSRGQALDVVAAASRRYDADGARRIAVLKSGRYTVVRPLTLGALAADRPDLARSFAAFGEPVGEAFQLRDDLLGAFGSARITGKPVGDDLREGKATLLMAFARARVTGASAAVLDRVGSPGLDATAVAEIQDVLITSGARDAAERTIDDLVARAFEALDDTPVSDEARAALRELVAGAVWRAA